MSAEHLRIMCPSLSCRRVLAVPTSSRGKNVRCKSCGATIKVPEKSAVQAPPPAEEGAEAPKDAPKTKAA
jgi:ribosomal protein S27E